VRIALEFADDAGFLARLRADMRKRLSESPVYDARAYVRAVEASYRRMWQEWCQALR
jgi:predicted O-linked N-acetylglucosamine transferase (SPINDLY family)